MRKVILYVAVSLDGYIADAQKSVHWIKGQDDSAEMLDTYTPFFINQRDGSFGYHLLNI